MDNFNFNRDFYDACCALGERDGGRLAMALLRYGYEGAEPDKLPPNLRAAFTLAKGRVDAMVAGSQGGKRGASAKSGKSAKHPTQDPTQGGTRGGTRGGSQGGTRPPTQDPGQVPSQQKEKEKEIEEGTPDGVPKKTRFQRPTVDEVGEYAASFMASKGLSAPFDPERFCDYYEANGWKVGRNPMRSWKAAARNWIAKDSGKGGSDDQRFEAYA